MVKQSYTNLVRRSTFEVNGELVVKGPESASISLSMKTSLNVLLSLMFRCLFMIIELQLEEDLADKIELTSKSLDSDIKSL